MLKSQVNNGSKKLWLQKKMSEPRTVNSNITPTSQKMWKRKINLMYQQEYLNIKDKLDCTSHK